MVNLKEGAQIMGDLMQDKDPEKARRVTEAMLRMKKLDIKTLQEAAIQV